MLICVYADEFLHISCERADEVLLTGEGTKNAIKILPVAHRSLP